MNTPTMPSQRTYALGVGRVPEFRLVYQPIFRVDSTGASSLFAYEALLRVENEGELTSASEHILHHENTGSIVAIDRWVAIQAMSFLRNNPECDVWLNVSRRSLSSAEYVNDILMILSYTQNSGRVTLEVTESSEADIQSIERSLERLSKAGVNIVIDDLWDGFNHENMLESAYVKGCKFSSSTMIRSMNCSETRSSIRKLLAAFKADGRCAVIEGIESPELLEQAKNIGFELFQGWLFGKPLHL